MLTSNKIKAMIKADKVIASCKTVSQWISAYRYLYLYKKKYPDDKRSHEILGQDAIVMLRNIVNDN